MSKSYVSMRLILWFFHIKEIAAAEMVIPLSFSCGIKSITVSPLSTRPTDVVSPQRNNICSEVVVLPASMWATTPMLRSFCTVWKPFLNPSRTLLCDRCKLVAHLTLFTPTRQSISRYRCIICPVHFEAQFVRTSHSLFHLFMRFWCA